MRVWIEEGPGGKTGALQKIQQAGESEAIITDSVVHCLLCRHPLMAQRSVKRGLGPVCARRMIAVLMGGDAR